MEALAAPDRGRYEHLINSLLRMIKHKKEKGTLRIIFERIIFPAIAIGTGWLLFYVWPPVLLVYLLLFIALIVIGAIGWGRGK